jgi:hypothetical protein
MPWKHFTERSRLCSAAMARWMFLAMELSTEPSFVNGSKQ